MTTKHYAPAEFRAAGERADQPGRRVYTFLASNETLDRQGEVVTANGWELANYRRNPVILDGHDYRSIESIVGRAVEVREVEGGIEADVIFNDTPRGQLATALVECGDLRAVSVGFMPIEMAVPADRKEPVRHTRKELMEISTVPIPANPDALRLRSVAEPATKAGRVLSAKNETRLREALNLLGEVLASLPEAGAAATDDGDKAADAATTKAADGPDPDALDRLVAGLAAVKQRIGA